MQLGSGRFNLGTENSDEQQWKHGASRARLIDGTDRIFGPQFSGSLDDFGGGCVWKPGECMGSHSCWALFFVLVRLEREPPCNFGAFGTLELVSLGTLKRCSRGILANIFWALCRERKNGVVIHGLRLTLTEQKSGDKSLL